jgi:rod shape-determining protein MreC
MALYGRARNTRLLVVSLVMLSLVTITVDYRGGQSGPFEVAGRGALSIVGALQSGVSKVIHPVSAFLGGIAHIGSLQAENDRLKSQLQAARDQTSHAVSMERENKELKRLLKIRQDLGLSGVTAVVIAESPSNFEWSVTIDRGSSAGVKVDSPVVSGQGLIGHVVQVALHWSKVQLIIDPHSAVAGRLASSGETGLLVGQRNRDLTMDLVNPDAKVIAGEQVVTSGYQGGLYPSEIVIGIVSHTYQQPGTLNKLITVRPSVDFSALQYVLVLKQP